MVLCTTDNEMSGDTSRVNQLTDRCISESEVFRGPSVVSCFLDNYRMLKINVLCNYSLSLHFWLRQSGELGTVMCLDKTSHARETGGQENGPSTSILIFLQPDIMQNVAFPWASDIRPAYLVTHRKQLSL
ncbi:hypothetical protein CMV_016769 [Castanea mollissima]|uniref:Uncharacterized protein n=1 Tax=Castanea mollissima TaxID=60419 RepID=A0A8J4VHU8_9ROSI|nr:hypothetical protein CMV_016769 [Castanea mollissima]